VSVRLRVFADWQAAEAAHNAEPPTEANCHGLIWCRPGWCWPIPDNDLPDRKCWAIVLPGRTGIWTTTDRSSDEGNPLWDVTGEPPNLTVKPSIDASPGWHGHITDGVLTLLDSY
jgi:hypothetical protein